MTKVLIAPGLGSSGPNHWQTLWEIENPEYKRIEQKEWDNPNCKDWVKKIEEEVAQSGENIIIVAHSLACIALTHWATKSNRRIKGALLVAPADAEEENFPKSAVGFSPIPKVQLPFPSIVVGSTDDEYISFERCSFLAHCWGSKLINIGAKGHINSSSNLGPWEEGKKYLRMLDY